MVTRRPNYESEMSSCRCIWVFAKWDTLSHERKSPEAEITDRQTQISCKAAPQNIDSFIVYRDIVQQRQQMNPWNRHTLHGPTMMNAVLDNIELGGFVIMKRQLCYFTLYSTLIAPLLSHERRRR